MEKSSDKLKSKYHLRKVQPVKNRNAESHKLLTKWRQMERGVVLQKKNAKDTKNNKKVKDTKNPQIKYHKIFKQNQQQSSYIEENIKFIPSMQQRASQGCGFISSNNKALLNQFYQRQSRLQHQKSMTNYRQRKIQLASRNKSLNYWRKNHQNKIVSTVKNFFNKIFQSQNGCTCQEPCTLGKQFFSWTRLNEENAKKQYLRIAQIMQMRKLSNNSYQQKQLDKNFKQIKKDIERTQPQHPTYRNNQFLQSLQRILMCYVIQDSQLGYVQGMNLILSGIIFHVKNQYKSYFIFKKLMKYIRKIYLNNFKQSYIHIQNVSLLLKKYINDLYLQFQKLEIDLNTLILSWILSLMTSVIKLDYSYLIYQGFIKQKWIFIYKIILSIFVYFKDQLKQKDDACDILVMLSSNNNETFNLNWDQIAEYANSLKIDLNNFE